MKFTVGLNIFVKANVEKKTTESGEWIWPFLEYFYGGKIDFTNFLHFFSISEMSTNYRSRSSHIFAKANVMKSTVSDEWLWSSST